MKYVTVLLVFLPVSIAGSLLHWDYVLVFFASALGVILLARESRLQREG